MKLTHLITITDAQPISQLTEAQIKELQIALSHLGYPIGDIDGLIGPKTRNAWAEFKTDVFQGNPDLIGPGSIETLKQKLEDIGEEKIHDFSTKEGTIAAIKWECKAQGIGLNTQIAYVLATVKWETAQTFKPVKEAFWKNEEWRRKKLRYFPYYGRGYVQLTWKNNYEKYSKILGIDLVNNPDLAMKENIALFILVHGFKTGAFTGRKITDYIDSDKTDFINARRNINGRDHAHEIANFAKQYLNNL
jgi:hypothetical protein